MTIQKVVISFILAVILTLAILRIGIIKLFRLGSIRTYLINQVMFTLFTTFKFWPMTVFILIIIFSSSFSFLTIFTFQWRLEFNIGVSFLDLRVICIFSRILFWCRFGILLFLIPFHLFETLFCLIIRFSWSTIIISFKFIDI